MKYQVIGSSGLPYIPEQFPPILNFLTGISQESAEGEEGASGWGSAVSYGPGSRSQPSVPGNNPLVQTDGFGHGCFKTSLFFVLVTKEGPGDHTGLSLPLSPTPAFCLLCLCRGLQSWRTSGSWMTPGPPLSAGPSSYSGPPCWRARCLSESIICFQKRVYRPNMRILTQVVEVLITNGVCVAVCRRGPCRRMAGPRWMRSNILIWSTSRTCWRPKLWSSTGSRTWELSLRWEIFE